jgi:phosphate transport system substrate-binding protein
MKLGKSKRFSQPLPSCISVSTILLLLSLASCTPSPHPPPTTATPVPAAVIKISGSGTALPVIQKLADAYSQTHPGTTFQIESGTNTGGAIQGVLQETLDLAAANRPLSDSEAQKPLEYHAFARDPVAFVTNKPNPITGLSSEQVRKIYSGQFTNWQQLGGAPAPIIVLDRDPDESARQLMLIPFMNSRPVQAPTIVLNNSKAMVEALESTPHALGYSSVGLLKMMQAQRVQVLALDGTMPSTQAIQQKAYPWSLILALIHRRNPSPKIQEFVNFVLSSDGRQILENYGYASVTP